MNLKVIYTMLSRIMLVSGAMVALPLAISLIMGGPILAFIFSMAVAGLASVVLKKRGVAQENSLTPREGTAITALSWLFVSLLFALPYIFSGTLGPWTASSKASPASPAPARPSSTTLALSRRASSSSAP